MIKAIRPVSLVLVAALVLGGCGGGGYGSPQEVFDDFQKAATAKDWNKLMACMTPETQDAMVAGFVMMGAMAAAFGDKEMEPLLKKHGVDPNAKPDESITDPAEAMKLLAGKIKDKPAFVSDIMAHLEKKDPGAATQNLPSGTLTDVKIEGDAATATVVGKDKDGKEQKADIQFKKVDGSWLLHMGM